MGAVSAAAAGSEPARRDASPSTVATTATPTTDAPTTSVAPTAVTASSLQPTTTVTLPEPESDAADPVRTLVPNVVVATEVLLEDADRQPLIDAALAEGDNTVAVEAEPGTLCAIVPIAVPVMAGGRWERNGEPIAPSIEQRRDPPGFGDCITNDNAEAFREGVYQFVAVGPTGATSAAASVVVGVEAVDVWLVNNGDEPVCLVLISPSRADYYESHDTESPLLPGEAIAISAAAVEHDVRVFACPPDDSVRTFRFTPEPQSYVDMFVVDDDAPASVPTDSGAATAAPTTT